LFVRHTAGWTSEHDWFLFALVNDKGCEAFEELWVLPFIHSSQDWCRSPPTRVHCKRVTYLFSCYNSAHHYCWPPLQDAFWSDETT